MEEGKALLVQQNHH